MTFAIMSKVNGADAATSDLTPNKGPLLVFVLGGSNTLTPYTALL
jgi:hypothetical protein